MTSNGLRALTIAAAVLAAPATAALAQNATTAAPGTAPAGMASTTTTAPAMPSTDPVAATTTTTTEEHKGFDMGWLGLLGLAGLLGLRKPKPVTMVSGNGPRATDTTTRP